MKFPPEYLVAAYILASLNVAWKRDNNIKEQEGTEWRSIYTVT